MADEVKKSLKEIAVRISNAESVIFEGKAKSVTTVNKEGEFDVLPLHANFITLIKDKVRIRLAGTKDQDITITSGVMKVLENTVTIFLGIGIDSK